MIAKCINHNLSNNNDYAYAILQKSFSKIPIVIDSLSRWKIKLKKKGRRSFSFSSF